MNIFKRCEHEFIKIEETEVWNKLNDCFRWKEMRYICKKCLKIKKVSTK